MMEPGQRRRRYLACVACAYIWLQSRHWKTESKSRNQFKITRTFKFKTTKITKKKNNCHLNCYLRMRGKRRRWLRRRDADCKKSLTRSVSEHYGKFIISCQRVADLFTNVCNWDCKLSASPKQTNNRSNRLTLGDIHCGSRVQFSPVQRLHNERTVHLIFCFKSDLILSHWASSSFNMRTMPRVYNYRHTVTVPKPTPSPSLSWSRSLSMENVFITNSSSSGSSNSCETRLQTNNNHYKHRK